MLASERTRGDDDDDGNRCEPLVKRTGKNLGRLDPYECNKYVIKICRAIPGVKYG